MPAEFDPSKLLFLLVEHRVEFLVVGGVAAILHGSPVMTNDLDVVYETKPENLDHLLRAIESIHAIYRDPASRVIVPDIGKLATMKIHLLKTDLGPLDLLKSIGADLTYGDLIEKTVLFEVGGLQLPVLNLETIIESKEYADRPKDRSALPFLHELLDRRAGKV